MIVASASKAASASRGNAGSKPRRRISTRRPPARSSNSIDADERCGDEHAGVETSTKVGSVVDGEITDASRRRRAKSDARDNPDGFYHGVKVRHQKRDFMLQGPPARFVAGNVRPVMTQMELFPA